MKKILLIFACFLLLVSQGSAGWFKGSHTRMGEGGAAPEYTSVNWTTSTTESDEGNDITIDSATKVSFVNLVTRQETGYVYRDFGAAFFDTDFTFRFQTQVSNMGSSFQMPGLFTASDSNSGDKADLIAAGADFVNFRYYHGDANMDIMLYENGSLVDNDGTATSVSLSTVYYVTITRDDDAGANSTGLYTAYICTTAYCTGGGNLHDTLTVDSSAGEQNDFRYIFGIATNDDDGNAADCDGEVENMEYKESL